jgi:hypothetical protein
MRSRRHHKGLPIATLKGGLPSGGVRAACQWSKEKHLPEDRCFLDSVSTVQLVYNSF